MSLAAPTPSFSTTFGVYDEGEHVRSLYLREVDAEALLRTLAPMADAGRLAVLAREAPAEGLEQIDEGCWLCTVQQVRRLSAPVEFIVLDGRASSAELAEALPTSVLADPGGAVRPELGARIAGALSEDGNAVILSRDTRMLAPFLRSIVEQASRKHAADLPAPHVPDQALLELLAPMRASAWCDLSLTGGSRYRVMVLRTIDGQEGGRCLDEQRWVAPSVGGHWRVGWSW